MASILHPSENDRPIDLKLSQVSSAIQLHPVFTALLLIVQISDDPTSSQLREIANTLVHACIGNCQRYLSRLGQAFDQDVLLLNMYSMSLSDPCPFLRVSFRPRMGRLDIVLHGMDDAPSQTHRYSVATEPSG